MSGNLEAHFKLIDFTKNLLFNSETPEQEEQARKKLELIKSVEKDLIIM